ncbi:unnamed protein product [Adineta ricciae]|uniref:DUF7164 domain-containing protein n=1 Tax=Adineta ricciae TaxID=249248 RepID=A0A815LRI9_ADIRI|nr:unnamed protein product [Adineta ricciae]CAF1413772.1 unnamed protein product [Adineta ricciae]
MFRLKTVSSLLVYGAAALVFLVFLLHFYTPSYHWNDNGLSEHPDIDSQFITFEVARKYPIVTKKTTSTTTVTTKEVDRSLIECRDKALTIDHYRTRSVVRGVIVRFPSLRARYYFVQFRWLYRSWIESEMFTLDRWRTDLIILIDKEFDNETQQLLEHLNCRSENERTSRRQISRCILVQHQLYSERTQKERENYLKISPMLNRAGELSDNVDRLFAVHSYISRLRTNETLYDILMVTTMNTFLTTQFGKYIPVKCAFILGTSPDYSTFYGQTEQVYEFVSTLLKTLKDPRIESKSSSIDYASTIEALQTRFLFTEKQVDIPCDSTLTTYRTYIYHLKCYAHSTSLFSERMFRQNAYDGYDKEPFNIYVAREYATLMALQSKVLTLDALRSLAANVTRREVFT